MIELVGEIGINANGDVGIAKKLIDLCSTANFQYIKFQKRSIDSCYTKEELDTPRISPWGTTTREQKIGLEFTFEQYQEIDEYCKGKGIKWFASVWDIKSVFLLKHLGSCFIKIPSAHITNLRFLELCVKSTNLPIIISTGMSTMQMIEDAMSVIPSSRLYALLHCTSTYPSKSEEQNLSMIPILKRKFPNIRIGFSNHSPGLLAMIIAGSLGAEMIELHVTLDRSAYGSDQASSIEPGGILKIGKYIHDLPVMMGDGVKRIYPSEEPIIKKLRKPIE